MQALFNLLLYKSANSSIVEELSFIDRVFAHRITGFFSIQVYRGEVTCPKKGCMMLNALIAAKLLLYRLNPQKANQFTVDHAFLNTELNHEKSLESLENP